MSKIISIGMIPSFSYVEDYAKAHNIEHINIMDCYLPDDIFSTVLSEKYDYIFINLEEIDGTRNEIIDFFKTLGEATNSPIIIGASKFMPESELIMGIRDVGISKFVFSDIMFEQKQEFDDCMKNNVKQNKRIPNVVTMDKPSKKTAVMPDRSYITVGVISNTQRMGTTTAAIQMVKYFKMMGYKACYIQHNNSPWVQEFEKWIDGILHDAEIGKITYQDVDMFYNIDKINSIIKMGYDYYVYDYGTNDDSRVSFLERDIKICVAGTSPSEMNDTQQLINSYYDADVLYCFNFVPDAERDEIMELMIDKSDKTFFINECADPFFLSSPNIETYKQYISIREKENGIEAKEKKKRFFQKEKNL